MESLSNNFRGKINLEEDTEYDTNYPELIEYMESIIENKDRQFILLHNKKVLLFKDYINVMKYKIKHKLNDNEYQVYRRDYVIMNIRNLHVR